MRFPQRSRSEDAKKDEGHLVAPLFKSWKDVPLFGGEGFLAGVHIGWISHKECKFMAFLVDDTQQEPCLFQLKCEFMSSY